MKIALIGRKNGQSDSAHKNLSGMLINFAGTIYKRGHEPIFDEETMLNLIIGTDFFKAHEETIHIKTSREIVQKADVCIVMGGDGTMLNAAKSLADGNAGIPILGINLGRVGFITDVPFDFDSDRIITMLEKVEYTIEKRTMLALRGPLRPGIIGWKAALNDVVISRSTGKIIEFKVSVDGEYAYTARGDGLMVTTPTGSTAYALSGGGPIIHPTARVIEILPIMAQSLSTRPLIITDTSNVEFELVSGDAEIYVDGNLFLEIKPGENVEVTRADRKVEFIHPKMKELTYSYYNTLAEKLNWHHLPGTPRS
jgi:NAD+ kinase